MLTPLRVAVGLCLTVVNAPATAVSADVAEIINESARAVRLNPKLWSCLIERESRANPYAMNVAGKGFQPPSLERAKQTLSTLPRDVRLRINYPWRIVDARGLNQRFKTEDEAKEHARQHGMPAKRIDWDAPNIDVGLSQINWHWHGRQFDRLEDLFDARLNAYYGAHYLRDLIDRHGISAGIGRYHSHKSPERREHYRSLVAGCLKSVGGIEHAVE
ncbi:MAG: hypothetical protein ACPG4N_06180 [Gammaproteobacteria bacterium]